LVHTGLTLFSLKNVGFDSCFRGEPKLASFGDLG